MIGGQRSGAAYRQKAAGIGRPLVCCIERMGLEGAWPKPEAEEAGTKNAERVSLSPPVGLGGIVRLSAEWQPHPR